MNRCCEKSSGCPGQCGQGKSMRSSHLRWDSSVRRSHVRGSQILAFQAGLCKKIRCLKVDYDSIGIPRGFSSKESAWQCRRHGLHLWVRKVPWSKKKWPPTQHFYLENSMERGAWRATVHGVPGSNRTERAHLSPCATLLRCPAHGFQPCHVSAKAPTSNPRTCL